MKSSILRFLLTVISSALLPTAASAIGAAGDSEWPKGAAVETQLKLAASLDENGKLRIAGSLTITNSGGTELTIQEPTNRLVLAFLVFNSLGNPVPPELRGKSDPSFQTMRLAAGSSHEHRLDGLDFVTGSSLLGYNLVRGQAYRVIAVYRPAGPNGPGFASQETKVVVPP